MKAFMSEPNDPDDARLIPDNWPDRRVMGEVATREARRILAETEPVVPSPFACIGGFPETRHYPAPFMPLSLPYDMRDAYAESLAAFIALPIE